ncbi:hypothetical protein [Kineosporia babensis]|uniref:Uncharacterized protein n=1 Tax=Kineosporia babensis TaxID=499548 RepID=A0A9X1NN23_9ACTN|nr:hypothetical protein [Kineosporia babensis]MCD5316739.1 hypothetical protein [Kineosporia babensis]
MASSSPTLTLGGKIVAAAGVLFLITSFLPYFRFCSTVMGSENCANGSAWDFTSTKIAALLVIVLVVEVVVVQLAKVKLPDGLGGLLNLGRLVVSAVAALLVGFKIAVGQSTPEIPTMPDMSSLGIDSSDFEFDMGFSRGIGIFLGLVFALALVAGNVLRLNEAAPAADANPGAGSAGPWNNQGGQQFQAQPGPYDQNQYGQNQQNQYGQNQNQYGQGQDQYGQYGQPTQGNENRYGQQNPQYPPNQGGQQY